MIKNKPQKIIIIVLCIFFSILLFLPSSSLFMLGKEKQTFRTNNNWEIVVRDFYQGTKLGSLQEIYLQDGYGFITLEACFKNLSDQEQVIFLSDISISIGESDFEIFPIGQAYMQSEVFSWLVPILAPIGAKKANDDLWYTPIQSYELIRLPPFQSKGCVDSYQYKTFAFLFMIDESQLNKPVILRFFDSKVTLVAQKPIVIPRDTVHWLKRLGWVFLVTSIVLVWLKNKRQKKQNNPNDIISP
jgi:preprotein translocase subunit SecG